MQYVPRSTRFFNLIESLSLIANFLTSCCIYFIDEDSPYYLKNSLLLITLCFHFVFLLLISFKLIREISYKYGRKATDYLTNLYKNLHKNKNEKKNDNKYPKKNRKFSAAKREYEI